MILVEQCEHCGAKRFIAHSKLSNVCSLPAIVTLNALSYSFPQFSHLFIGAPFIKVQVLNLLEAGSSFFDLKVYALSERSLILSLRESALCVPRPKYCSTESSASKIHHKF